MSITHISDITTLIVDAQPYSASQIEAAVRACRQLELAYARVSEDARADNAPNMDEVLTAREFANQALNDFDANVVIPQEAEGRNARFGEPEDTEGGTCD